MIELYKKFMHYERESLILDVSSNEKENIDYINEVYKNWNEFKKETLKVTGKMRDSWNKEETIDRNNYTG